MPKANTRKVTRPPRRGRPPLPPGKRRVWVKAQRVRAETLAKLERLAKKHGGIGRVIDAALAKF